MSLSTEEYKALKRENKRLQRELRLVKKQNDVFRLSIGTQISLAQTFNQEMRRQEMYINLLLESCPDIMMVFDSQLCFLLGTDSIKNIIAVEEVSYLRGRSITDIVEKYSPPALTPEIVAASETATRCEGECPPTSFEVEAGKDTYEADLLPFFKNSGEYAGLLIVMHDITELVKAINLAKMASAAKGEFLSRMSHEIRTPLNAIVGMSTIAQNTAEAQRKDYCLAKIDKASKHLLGLINDILDVAKIEADKLELYSSPFDFIWMIENITSLLDIHVEEKRQKLEIHLGEDLPRFIIGDELRLTQVLTNLLTNAIKFTPEGGTISLSAKREGQTMEIAVTDTGIGISKEQQARLFKAFEQADIGTTRKYGGSGLGLAITKRIVEMMKGQIWVESELGEGAAFTFTFPFQASDSKEEIKESETAEIPNLKGHTLLIAEDVDINREIMLALLEETGLEMDFAENGREAVTLFAQNPKKYNLILMDIQMPEMDGYDATHCIRGLGTGESLTVPIVALTANAFQEDITRCLEAGMNSHLGKPIDEAALFKVLRQFL